MSGTPDIEELVGNTDPNFQYVLSCVFGIQDHESRTYLVLLDHPETTVTDLAATLDRDRSNVNRSLTTLLEKGLAERQRRLLEPGGYVYQYRAVPIEEAKTMLHDALDDWVTAVHERIDAFGDDG
ncbi:helix-turn-helix domain-containing protein [Haloferacaceae archaeon DSL9]